MTLHEELIVLRSKGVPLDGICTLVDFQHERQLDTLLQQRERDDTTVRSWVFPVEVNTKEGHSSVVQYHNVSNDADVSYKHAYLCER